MPHPTHDKFYFDDDICDLLERAASLGFSLERGSILEHLTIEELEKLVTLKM